MEFNILDLTLRLHHSMTVPTEGGPWRAVGHFSVEVSGPVGSLQGQVAHLQALWTLHLRQLHPLWLGGQIQGLTGFLNTQRQQISRGGAMCTHTHSGLAEDKGVHLFQLCREAWQVHAHLPHLSSV